MCRIFVRLQGAPKGAYYRYVTLGATLEAGKKTSTPWRTDLFVSEALSRSAYLLTVGISWKNIDSLSPDVK